MKSLVVVGLISILSTVSAIDLKLAIQGNFCCDDDASTGDGGSGGTGGTGGTGGVGGGRNIDLLA